MTETISSAWRIGKILSDPIRSRGCFATRDIEAGASVFSCPAFAVVYFGDSDGDESGTSQPSSGECKYSGVSKDGAKGSNAELVRVILKRLAEDPSSASELADLYPTQQQMSELSEEMKELVKSIYAGQEFVESPVPELSVERIKCMVVFDCFALTNGKGVALSPTASYLNHDCFPNCTRLVSEDGSFELRTLRDVHAGEELCISYVPPFRSRENRLQFLRQHYGFDCLCSRCVTPPILCPTKDCGAEMEKDRSSGVKMCCPLCKATRWICDIDEEMQFLRRRYDDVIEFVRFDDIETATKEHARFAERSIALLGRQNPFDQELYLAKALQRVEQWLERVALAKKQAALQQQQSQSQPQQQ